MERLPLYVEPATRRTVTTTTTTTTVRYPPISLPVAAETDPPLDPKLYPLARRRPEDAGPRRIFLRMGSHDAYIDVAPPLAPSSPVPSSSTSVPPASAKRPHSSDISQALSPPPSKRHRLELPSPHLSPRQEQPPSPSASTASPPSESVNNDPPDSLSYELSQSSDLATLSSLSSLVSSFSGLSPDLQYHVLSSLLRRCPVPVLQSTSSFIAPGLRRDFLTDLPPELAMQVIGYLDAQTLCRCAGVCKSWKRLVDTEGKVWKARLHEEGLWVGHGTEDREEGQSLNAYKRDSLSHRRSTTIGEDCDLDEETFLRLWEGNVWDFNFDTEAAAVDTAEKLSQVAARRRRPPTPTTAPEFLPPRSTSPAGVRESAGVHPLKQVFKNRFLNRHKWFHGEPERTVFSSPGNHVETCLQFDKDRIISASDDRIINVFSTKTGQTLQQLEGHDGGVWTLEYIGDTLVSGSTDRTVRVWDLSRGTCTHTFVGHTSTVRCLQIVRPRNVNPDRSGPPIWEPPYPLVITGSRDWTLRVWKLPFSSRDASYHPYIPMSPSEDITEPAANPYHVRVLTGHRQPVRALAAHGRIVVSGSYDHDVRIWDSLSGKCTNRLTGHTEKVYSVVLDASRRRCASGSMDGYVRIWNIDDGTCVALTGHAALVGLLGLSPNYLVSAGADSHLRIWNMESGACRHILANLHQGAITCFQHDEQKVLSGADGSLKLWDIRKGRFVRDLLSGLTGVWQVAYNDRFCVAAVQQNNTSEFHVLDFGGSEPEHNSVEKTSTSSDDETKLMLLKDTEQDTQVEQSTVSGTTQQLDDNNNDEGTIVRGLPTEVVDINTDSLPFQ